jgi:putative membrane protein
MNSLDQNRDRPAYIIIGLVSSIVLGFLFWLIYFKAGAAVKADWVAYLPALNASLNGTTALLLILGVWLIRRGQRSAHIRTMLTATLTSGLFLVSYIIYHHYHGDSKYTGEGWLRTLYFIILISHIILSMAVVPMVFATLYHAGKKNYEKHKKLARITFPIWLYVSVTGVAVYFFLNG